jgi:hypothetical protein
MTQSYHSVNLSITFRYSRAINFTDCLPIAIKTPIALSHALSHALSLSILDKKDGK